MHQESVDVNGKKFYGWRVSTEGKVDFGANSIDDIFDMIRKSMLEGREIVIKPEHWGGNL